MKESLARPVLVTGGAGFVGSHVVRRLLLTGPVHVIDNLSSGRRENLPPGTVFHECDIRDAAAVQRIFRQFRFGDVVHCAAQTSVARSMLDPDEDWQINVQATHTLVRLSEQLDVRRFVFLSSGGAVYGETDHPAVETEMVAPISHYGLNKYAGEQLLRTSTLSYAILRPANIYGPGQRHDAEGGVVSIFIERLLADAPVTLHGDGRQRRDFVNVSDVVDAVELALEAEANVIWNVASGESTSIEALLALLRELTHSFSRIERRKRREGDVDCSLLSPGLIMQHGWGPPLLLRDGLSRLLATASVAPAELSTVAGS